MSFAGHVQDMINRMSSNEALRKSSKNRYAKLKSLYLDHKKLIPEESFVDPRIARQQLEEIKARLKEKLKKEDKIKKIRYFIITGIAVSILIYILFW